MERGPFDWVREPARRHLLAALTLLLVGCALCLASWDRALVSAAAPHGIVSFELAWSLERSEAMLRSWSPEARSKALLLQGFDYLYLFVYPAWFALASDRLALRLGGSWERPGLLLAWLVLAAAPLDAVENYALIQQLLEGASVGAARLAWCCAVPKFALVAAAALFLLIGGATALARTLASRPRG